MPRKRDIAPVHPGELLFEEFMRPHGLTQYRLAKATGLPLTRVNQIVRGKRAVTAETALRLGRFFDMTPQFWMNAQSHYDLCIAESEHAGAVRREVTPLATMADA